GASQGTAASLGADRLALIDVLGDCPSNLMPPTERRLGETVTSAKPPRDGTGAAQAPDPAPRPLLDARHLHLRDAPPRREREGDRRVLRHVGGDDRAELRPLLPEGSGRRREGARISDRGMGENRDLYRDLGRSRGW